MANGMIPRRAATHPRCGHAMRAHWLDTRRDRTAHRDGDAFRRDATLMLDGDRPLPIPTMRGGRRFAHLTMLIGTECYIGVSRR